MSERVFEGLLTEKEAAEFLGIKPATLHFWRKTAARRGPSFIKIGWLVRYRLADLETYLKERTVQSTA
jgi:predicted DNA-binding transcriptional regulator AlpA